MDKQKLQDAERAIEFLSELGKIGRKFLAKNSYYQIVWGALISLAASVNLFYRNWIVWPIASLIGFFLTTANYAGYIVSAITWIVLTAGAVLLYYVKIPEWLFIVYISTAIVLGFMIPGIISKKSREEHVEYGPIGVKMGILWSVLLSSAVILALIFSHAPADWGFIIVLFVGIGYIITGALLFSASEFTFLGVSLVVVDLLFYLLLKEYFTIFYIILGASALITGIYARVKYDRPGSSDT